MAYSRIVAVGDGSTTQFAVNFALDYLQTADVTCRVGTEVDGSGQPIYRTITFLSTNLVQISGTAPGAGVKVAFERTVSKSTLNVDYNDGDQLDEDNLMVAQKQAMMAIHEVLDGRLGPLTQDIDAGQYSITNLRQPVADNDAATKVYVDTVTDVAVTAGETAVAAAAAAGADADQTAADRAAIATDKSDVHSDKLAIEAAIAAFPTAKATQAQAEAGTDDAAYMTPLKTKEAILANGSTLVVASSAEAKAGTDNTKAMTPLRVREAIVVREAWLNIRDTANGGADPAASDNAAAFATLKTKIAQGTTIYVPNGEYKTSGYFINDLNGKSIRVVGDGHGSAAASGGSQIRYTGTAGNLVRLDGTNGFKCEAVSFTYDNPSLFFVPLINCRTQSGGIETAFIEFDGCTFRGLGTAKGAILVDISKTLNVTIKNGFMQNCYFGILGAHSAGDHSNCVYIEKIWFNGLALAYVLFGGLSWSMRDCIAEPPGNWGTGVIDGSAGFGGVSPLGITSLLIDNLSAEDGLNTGTWFNWSAATDYGAPGPIRSVNVFNSFFQGAVQSFILGTTRGAAIIGNQFVGDSPAFTHIDAASASRIVGHSNTINTNGGPDVGRIFEAGAPPTLSQIDFNDGRGIIQTGRNGTGYAYLPGGTLMQWGTSAVGTAWTAIAFGKAFSGTPTVTATCNASGPFTVGVNGVTTTGFQSASSTAANVSWIAIGPATS